MIFSTKDGPAWHWATSGECGSDTGSQARVKAKVIDSNVENT